jgi:CheY-like chemotaxis protein
MECLALENGMKFNPLDSSRILVIDDDPGSHDLLRRLLLKFPFDPNQPNSDTPSRLPRFEIDSAYQGEEGLALIEKSLQENHPYSLAFVDVRMPPGWDGIQTTCKIWEKYPDLQVIISTAYSDYSWEEIVKSLGFLDRVVILNKPFSRNVVMQLAVSMSEKWRLNQQAKLRVDNLEQMLKCARLR